MEMGEQICFILSDIFRGIPFGCSVWNQRFLSANSELHGALEIPGMYWLLSVMCERQLKPLQMLPGLPRAG